MSDEQNPTTLPPAPGPGPKEPLKPGKDWPAKNSTTIVWHLMVFDKATEKLVTSVALTESQIAALKPHLGIVDTDDHFGSYPVAGLDWFAEEHVGSHD